MCSLRYSTSTLKAVQMASQSVRSSRRSDHDSWLVFSVDDFINDLFHCSKDEPTDSELYRTGVLMFCSTHFLPVRDETACLLDTYGQQS